MTAPTSAPLLFGLNSSAIYVGVAAGGVLGAVSQDWIGPTLLGIPAAILAVLAILFTLAEGGKTQAGDTNPRARGGWAGACLRSTRRLGPSPGTAPTDSRARRLSSWMNLQAEPSLVNDSPHLDRRPL